MLHAANAILAFIAVMLTGLVTLNSLQREVPLPNNFIKWALAQALGDVYEADWTEAAFDLRGGLYLENFHLRRSSIQDTVLNARMLRIDFSIFDLVLGLDWPVQEINASGVGIFIPASFSPSGLNEPVMEVSNARLYLDNDDLIVDYLNVDCHGIRFFISGSGPLHDLLDSGRDSDTAPKPNFLPELLARIHRLPATLDLDCRVHWSTLDGKLHSFDLLVLSESLDLPMAKLVDLRASAELQAGPDGLSLNQVGGNAVLTFINPNSFPPSFSRWPLAPPIAISFSAAGTPVSDSLFAFPSDLRVNLNHPFSNNFPVDVIIAETSLDDEAHRVNWILNGSEIFAAGLAYINNQTGQAQENSAPPWLLDFRAEVANPVLHSFFPDLPYNRHLENAHARNLRLRASLSTQSESVSGILFADDLFLGQTRFAHLRSHFSLSKTDLQLTDIQVRKSKDEFASGSYFQNFSSNKFSLNAVGMAFPKALDSILGSWWPRIFTHIQTPNSIPADVTVWGHWDLPGGIRSMTSVVGKDVSYRGMPVPELSVRVRSNADWAYLESLIGQFPEGRVEGRLGWVISGEPGTGKHPMLLDLKSDARWEVVQAASGITALERMQFAGHPEVKVSGVIWHDLDTPAGGEDRYIPQLKLELNQRKAFCEIEGWELGGVSFSGKLTEDELVVDRLAGTFAEGVLTGNLAIRNWEDAEQRQERFELQLFDADYGQVMAQVQRNQKDSRLLNSALTAEPSGGRIDTSMSLNLNPGAGRSKGSGQITLRKAPIGQFHVLGGLSRFLSSIGLGFSTLNLDSGAIDWELKEGILEISRCDLSGPVLNLGMSGTVDLLERQLALRADAYFFSGLISKVLTPVSDNFQFDITGPVENPIWKLRLNPLRWFQNRLPQDTSAPASP